MSLKEIVISNTLEEKEIKNLSEFATKSRFTEGRKVFEEKCPLRTEFQRDRDRIIHSKSFRRLKHKAQVFFSPDDDHYRTRMTHTLEVSQCARTISRALNLNEDLTEAIALGHDLGHTPFGHSGESALNEIMSKGFKHNENSVRVVTLIENLNLTQETIDGIYSHSYDCPPAKTLEGQVVKFADKIAYIHHDMDDAIRAGIMKVEDLPADCLNYFSTDRTKHLSKMICNVVENSFDKDKISMDEECLFYMKKVRSWMFDNVYTNSLAKSEEDKAKKLIIELFNNYLELMTVVSTDYDEIKAQQAACDCISGMTDRYIVKTYLQNFIPAEMSTKPTDDFIFRFAKLNGLINEYK